MTLKLSLVRDILKNGGLSRALELEREYIDKLRGDTSGAIEGIIKFYSGRVDNENTDPNIQNQCKGCNDSINKEVQNTLIEEIKALRKNRLLSIFFEIIARKIRRGNFYSTENLLEKLNEILEKIFPESNINIYAFIGGRNGLIDCVNKSENGRKVFTSINELKISESIRLGLNEQKKFHSINSNGGIICYKPIPELGDAVIFHFEGCCEEEINMAKYLMEALSEIIIQGLEKINDKYISEVTGCKNRNFFNEHREDKSYSVIAIDLNNFKSINDKYGHSQGDKVLREFGKLLKSCVRENEGEVVHFSGDEFGILVKLGNNGGHISIMDKITNRIDNLLEKGLFNSILTNSETGKDEVVYIDFSMGVCENKIGKGNQALEECYKQADMDMLRTKDPNGFTNRLIATLSHLGKGKIIETLNRIANHFGLEISYKEKTK